MGRLQAWLEGWVVSPRVLAFVLVGVLAAIAVVVVGGRTQPARTIPTPQSATVVQVGADGVRSEPVRLGPGPALLLADTINQLSRRPGGIYNCGAASAAADRIQFSAGSQQILAIVQIGGCLGVDVSSAGSDWHLGKWDPGGRLRSAVQQAINQA